MKKLKILIGVLLLSLFMISCSEPTVGSLVTEFIEKNCNDSSSCVVSIKDFTHFKWDKMYVFEYNVTDEEIEQELRQKFNEHSELVKRLFFLRGDSIVHYEEHEIDFERPAKNELHFYDAFYNSHKRIVAFTPTSAVFVVTREKWFDEYVYYTLIALPISKLENLKAKDSTVVYAERLDNEHALLYRSNYPNTMFFVKLSDSSLYEVDSIVDFYYDFTVYQTEADLIKNRRDILKKMDDGDRLKKMIEYGTISHPIMNRFAGELFIVDDDGIYELSLSRRTFKRVIHYHMALDIFETCSDSMIWRLPNPQKSISSSAIRVSFQDSSFFELKPNGVLNIQVVDSNSCLKVKGEYNQVRYNYAEGKKCNARIPLCEPF